MLKLIAVTKYGREVIDRTLDRAEAVDLLVNYQQAFKDQTIFILPTKRQDVTDRVAELRRQGKLSSEIMAELGISRSKLNSICKDLGQAGVIDKRQPGARESLGDRYEEIAKLYGEGKRDKEISQLLNLPYLTVRSNTYKLRKQKRI